VVRNDFGLSYNTLTTTTDNCRKARKKCDGGHPCALCSETKKTYTAAQPLLKSLTITDFMDITTLTINFKPDTTLVIGDNTAGKTSVLLAIRLFYHMYSKFYDRTQNQINMDDKQLGLEQEEFRYTTIMKLYELVGPNEHVILTGIVGTTKYTFHITQGRVEVDLPEPVLESLLQDPALSAVYVPVSWTFKSGEQVDPLPGTDKLSIKNIEYMLYHVHQIYEHGIQDVLRQFFPDYILCSRSRPRTTAYFENRENEDALFFGHLSTSQQHILSIIALVMYSRLYLTNTIVLLDCPFAMLDSFNILSMWCFLQEQSNKHNIQIVITAPSIPDYIITSLKNIVNLNRMLPGYILRSKTPRSILEETAVIMNKDQLVTFDTYSSLIIFSNKKLQHVFTRQLQGPLLSLTPVLCDSDPFNVLTKLLTLNRYMINTKDTIRCLVVADHPLKEKFEPIIDLQWYHIQNDQQVSEYLPALEGFLHFGLT
jgi:energy-coupling factor transporter ATP-binding protein EcfA2